MAKWKALSGPLIASLVLVAGLGVAHGLATDRWGPSGELQQAVAAMDRIPTRFGDWAGEDLPFDPEPMTRAGIQRCVYRSYRNARTGEAVSFLLVCGRGGPISVHTPDVCYAGAGYRQTAEASTEQLSAGERTHTFRTTPFLKPGGVSQGRLQIYWAWSRDGREWTAPDSPRVAFGRAPALYKMYVVREYLPSSRSEATDSCQNFLRQALPDLSAALGGAD